MFTLNSQSLIIINSLSTARISSGFNKIMSSSAVEYLKSVKTVPRLFPWDPSSDKRKTIVVWDMKGYSISESFDPRSIMEQIELAIRRNGFEGEVSVCAYPENTWSKELEDKSLEAGLEVYPFEGVKSARFNEMISDIVSCSVMEKPSNLLILSQDMEEMEQFPNFSFLRQALQEKGFSVVLAEPDTLVNQETAFRGIHLDDVYELAIEEMKMLS